MTNYTRTKVNYRKIYEQHYGPIPKDSDGRTYEIHHIDGDHNNNSLDNLKCVSLKEHYDIHFKQGDWEACQAIAIRMETSPIEISKLATMATLAKISEGRHPWQGGDVTRRNNQIRIEEGIHNFLGENNPNQRRLLDGTHNFLNSNFQRDVAQARVKNGTHHFLGPEMNNKHQKIRIENGTHNFLGGEIQRKAAIKLLAEGRHPSQIKVECPHCGKIGGKSGMISKHFNNCSKKTSLGPA